jgi:hypothetical protein
VAVWLRKAIKGRVSYAAYLAPVKEHHPALSYLNIILL